MKLTEKEVVKALECCTRKYGCDDCPCRYYDLCMIQINKEALSLIKRQQTEIEKKTKKPQEIMPIVAELKAEAIKEFAERLKEYRYTSSDWSHGEHPMVVEWDDVEEVLYRMTEVKDDEGKIG